jgi:hypothetical protein
VEEIYHVDMSVSKNALVNAYVQKNAQIYATMDIAIKNVVKYAWIV